MNINIPVFAITGWSGSGKTTFIEGIIPELKKFGLKIAVIKHDAHEFEIDKEGKDTFRFSKVGAEVVAIASKTQSAVMENRFLNFEEILSRIKNVDLILIEGFKNENIKKIGIKRGNYELPEGEYIAVISDVPLELSVPVFEINDYKNFANWLLKNMKNN